MIITIFRAPTLLALHKSAAVAVGLYFPPFFLSLCCFLRTVVLAQFRSRGCVSLSPCVTHRDLRRGSRMIKRVEIVCGTRCFTNYLADRPAITCKRDINSVCRNKERITRLWITHWWTAMCTRAGAPARTGRVMRINRYKFIPPCFCSLTVVDHFILYDGSAYIWY